MKEKPKKIGAHFYFNFFCFLSGFSFATIREPQDCKETGMAFL